MCISPASFHFLDQIPAHGMVKSCQPCWII